jgi:acyl-CoA synthetase (AMP-forming)/AMP-acid ligase II
LECTVVTTINSDLNSNSDPRDIGFKIGSAVCCWIVEESDREKLVPIGATGELIIEGPVVARGYLNNPEKVMTAAAFI